MMADMPTSVTLDDHLARGGPSAAVFARLWEALWRQTYLPEGLLDLCRLSFARLHGDTAEIAAANPLAGARAGMAELRDAVLADRALDDGRLDAGEKAALLFAEYYWTDAQSIPDDIADAVKAHYGAAGLVFLIEALGCIDGRIRTARCLRDLALQRTATSKEIAHVD